MSSLFQGKFYNQVVVRLQNGYISILFSKLDLAFTGGQFTRDKHLGIASEVRGQTMTRVPSFPGISFDLYLTIVFEYNLCGLVVGN